VIAARRPFAWHAYAIRIKTIGRELYYHCRRGMVALAEAVVISAPPGISFAFTHLEIGRESFLFIGSKSHLSHLDRALGGLISPPSVQIDSVRR
jgi:hypothetical protein